MINLMTKKLNKKGFTLAELLVVVAIIAVLVAIAIPVFGAATKKAEFTADLANVRASYAEAVVDGMSAAGFDGTVTVTKAKLEENVKNSKVTTTAHSYTVTHNNDSSLTATVDVDDDVTISAS